MIIGPSANGKTMIAERFAVNHLKIAPPSRQKIWIIQTREGAGLTHFYNGIVHAQKAPFGRQYDILSVLIGDVSVYDAINATTEMACRFDVLAVARWS